MDLNENFNDTLNQSENSQDSLRKSESSQVGSIHEEGTSSQIDENSQVSKENESREGQIENFQEQKCDDTIINSKNIEILHSDINYGIVLAFIDKFGKHFSFKEIKFDQFDSSIINFRICESF